MVERAAAGEEIIFDKAERPMARLVPIQTTGVRVPGQREALTLVSVDTKIRLYPVAVLGTDRN